MVLATLAMAKTMAARNTAADPVVKFPMPDALEQSKPSVLSNPAPVALADPCSPGQFGALSPAA